MNCSNDVEHALLAFASTFTPYVHRKLTNLNEFSSGLVFGHMLATV